MTIKSYTIILLFLVLCSNCVTNKKQVSEPKISIEDCYQNNLNDSILMTGWYIVEDSGFVRIWEQTGEIFTINPCPILTAEDIIKVEILVNNSGKPRLDMNFGTRGTERWSIATKNSIGKRFAFIVNDKLLAIPVVQNQITSGGSALWAEKSALEKIKLQIEENIQQIKKQ